MEHFTSISFPANVMSFKSLKVTAYCAIAIISIFWQYLSHCHKYVSVLNHFFFENWLKNEVCDLAPLLIHATNREKKNPKGIAVSFGHHFQLVKGQFWVCEFPEEALSECGPYGYHNSWYYCYYGSAI